MYAEYNRRSLGHLIVEAEVWHGHFTINPRYLLWNNATSPATMAEEREDDFEFVPAGEKPT